MTPKKVGDIAGAVIGYLILTAIVAISLAIVYKLVVWII